MTERKTFREAHLDVEGFFNKHAETNLGLADAMKSAKRVSEYRSEGDYSYSMEKFIGDGYVLIGDAARFVDPIFSSGVSVALYSAKFAAECIQDAIESGDLSEARLKPYEETLRGGVEVWYEFIRLYYKLLPLFTHFIQSKEHRLGVLQLLQGEVFNRTNVPVLDAMRDYVRTVEESEDHLLRSQLTGIPLD